MQTWLGNLTQAIIEIGRINKTLYLLNYVDNEEYRRSVLTQLNRGVGLQSKSGRYGGTYAHDFNSPSSRLYPAGVMSEKGNA